MATQKQYEELDDMLSEWYKMTYDNKNKYGFIDKAMAGKYKLIRRFLNNHFRDDNNLKDYIKALPNIWILRGWHAEIIWAVCLTGFLCANPYIFKIYTGVTMYWRGSETDVIYDIVGIIGGLVYIYLLHKRGNVDDDLNYNLREIHNIVTKKCL